MPKPGRFWNKVSQFDKGNAPVPEMLRYRIEMPDAWLPIPTAMASLPIPMAAAQNTNVQYFMSSERRGLYLVSQKSAYSSVSVINSDNTNYKNEQTIGF